MPATLEQLRRIKCTYKDCFESFDTEKAMKSHKKYSDEHDYCHRCDEDYEDHDSYAFHKITKPEIHGKACRVCGEEFKSESGLKRHIELNHKIDQRLTCIGCRQSFYRACLFIEHLEFGHCSVISASQFQGHIVHKHLINEYLKGDEKYQRFQQKQAKFEAALDPEEEGGIELDGDALEDDEEIEEVKYEAIKPEVQPDMLLPPAAAGVPFPPLPSQMRSASVTKSNLASTLSHMSINGEESEASAVVNSPIVSPLIDIPASPGSRDTSNHQVSIHGSMTTSSTRQLKPWGSRDGKSASSVLFPNAKSTPAPSEFSIAAYDHKMEEQHGLNIMNTRFWDPHSTDFNPERFYDSISCKYYCPFVCEQARDTPADLSNHINHDHRIARMKCPMCLKYFKSATALMAHCESRGARCEINKTDDFGVFLDRLSGGFLGVEEKVRPDHLNNPSALVHNTETGRMERYVPPKASYLQYMVTKPPDWKEPVTTTKVVGGFLNMQRGLW
ncbi:hypothetical protein EK21DRAFT_113137 [Setomelanomma holmii]|uniref:C2H2-type domain-containing protein n=1 Tax=Setomelanomma holmii TaxID=210430 RepID=A0A9P4H9A9_9PLEO|nr:hypothetical protein EK21DRAFT_113137 [Setomelanomma holmii]